MKALTIFTALLLAALPVLHAAEAGALTLHHAGEPEVTLSRFGDLQPMLAKTATKGDWRLVVEDLHTLRAAVHLVLQPGQRLVIEGSGTDALLVLGKLSQNEAALCLESGQFELCGIGTRKRPSWSVQISAGVRDQLHRLRISDSRGGGIVGWEACGWDQSGPTENRIEQCVVERFITAKAKWTHTRSRFGTTTSPSCGTSFATPPPRPWACSNFSSAATR